MLLAFNSFSTSRCFALFEIILLLISCSLVSKSVFVTKSAYANLAVKTPAAKLLNSGFFMIMITNPIFNFTNFCIRICFFD